MIKCSRQDLNLHSSDYESATLTIKLQAQIFSKNSFFNYLFLYAKLRIFFVTAKYFSKFFLIKKGILDYYTNNYILFEYCDVLVELFHQSLINQSKNYVYCFIQCKGTVLFCNMQVFLKIFLLFFVIVTVITIMVITLFILSYAGFVGRSLLFYLYNQLLYYLV